MSRRRQSETVDQSTHQLQNVSFRNNSAERLDLPQGFGNFSLAVAQKRGRSTLDRQFNSHFHRRHLSAIDEL